jgi:GT2 family glycosyltransferase
MATSTLRKVERPQIRLEPQTAIDVMNNRNIAKSADAWLRVDPAKSLVGRRWVRLRYSSSYFDDPVRPLMSVYTATGQRSVQIMNGPILGSGEWIGRIPEGVTEAWISPVARAGPFAFQLDSIESLVRRDLIKRGLTNDPNSLFSSFTAKLVNAREERWELLKFAAGATPLADYAEWHRRLYRPIDLTGLDRPRSNWRTAPAIRLLIRLDHSRVEAFIATLTSLKQQFYPRWSLFGLTSRRSSPDVVSAFRGEMARDRRLAVISDNAEMSALLSGLNDTDAIAMIGPGDLLPDYALPVLAETLIGHPRACVVYGDEDSVTENGHLHSPLFKPDWSPVYFAASSSLGRLSCVRATEVRALNLSKAKEFYDHETKMFIRITKSCAGEIHHVRRILYRRQRQSSQASFQRPVVATLSRSTLGRRESMPEVSIIIPTRDRAPLLRQCLATLRVTQYLRFRLVIVDNGSRKADALALLRDLARTENCQVIKRPAPFNFSALCNDGARTSTSSVLVFLNNDITITDANWLETLVGWAIRRDIGAVGPKLLFPDMKIEHAGVVLGHTSLAGHIYFRRPGAEPGYMNQLLVPREVEAVTGACVAIERKKFEAIGGFDENLKVEFNDIDLCLRASDRGWKTIWTPETTLTHLHAATRGIPIHGSRLYQKDHEYFRERWINRLRDDRYFHPALSLFSYQPALA